MLETFDLIFNEHWSAGTRRTINPGKPPLEGAFIGILRRPGFRPSFFFFFFLYPARIIDYVGGLFTSSHRARWNLFHPLSPTRLLRYMAHDVYER